MLSEGLLSCTLATLLSLLWVLASVSGTVVHITGTLGGSVALPLETVSPEQMEQVKWKKGEVLLGKLKISANLGGIQGLGKASYIFPNGTLLIYQTEEEDNGPYTAAIYNASGVLIYTRAYLLHLQERVVSGEDEVIEVPFLVGGCASLDLDLQPPSYAIWKKGGRGLTESFAPNDTQHQGTSARLNAHVLSNGTLRLCQMSAADQGEYTADVMDGNGTLMARKAFKLWNRDGLTFVSVSSWGTLPKLILIVMGTGFSGLLVVLVLVICTMKSRKKSRKPAALESRGAEASTFTSEDTMSTRSREASTTYTEPPAPSNVSTFQVYHKQLQTPSS